jgi:hypothetical protein
MTWRNRDRDGRTGLTATGMALPPAWRHSSTLRSHDKRDRGCDRPPLRGRGALAVQEWAAQCHGADTGLVAQSPTVAGMAPPRELAEQRRGVIPRRVMARLCCVRALNARTRAREQVRFVREPRARRSPLEGGGDPRARRTLLEGYLVGPLWWATGAIAAWAVLCAYVLCYVRGVFAFFAGFKQDPPPVF